MGGSDRRSSSLEHATVTTPCSAAPGTRPSPHAATNFDPSPATSRQRQVVRALARAYRSASDLRVNDVASEGKDAVAGRQKSRIPLESAMTSASAAALYRRASTGVVVGV